MCRSAVAKDKVMIPAVEEYTAEFLCGGSMQKRNQTFFSDYVYVSWIINRIFWSN